MKRQTKPMLGGLNTKLPPTMLDGQFSPDLLNSVIRDGRVRKRGGMVPLFRDRMRGDALESVAYRTTARAWANAAGATDVEYVTQPGCMVAGHHALHEDGEEYDIAFWFRPTKLTPQQGGTARTGGPDPNVYATAPFTVRCQPILSKGPVRKSRDFPLSATWVAAGDDVWGDDAGMPFCFYLYNSGSGTAPVWTLRLSAHILDVAGTGNWTLTTAISSLPVIEGVTYHILGRVSGDGVTLRVGIVHAEEEPIYVEDSAALVGGTLGTNRSAIQVFDCPQQFVELSNVGSPTLRPGLNVNQNAFGGYFYGSKRAEGVIDQIAVWRERGGSLSDLDGSDRISWDGQVGLINLWSMGGGSLDYVQEESGRGNHLFLIPRGPVSIPDGKEGGSWFYNGMTSYAVLDTDTPNWRFNDATAAKVAPMYALVRDNMAHGLGVEFWIDSAEANIPQVVAEIHSVLRLEYDPVQGKLIGKCRNGGTAAVPTTAIEIGAEYQTGPTSQTVVQIGRRYSVALVRRDGGATLDLFIDGKLDASVGALNPSNYDVLGTPADGNSYPPGGITLGVGSFERMIRGASPTDAGMATSNDFHLTPSSAFVGRIETFRIITTANAASLVKRNGPEGESDWRFSENRLWSNPIGGDRKRLRAQGWAEPVRDVGRGSMPLLSTQSQGGTQVGGVIDSMTALGDDYFLTSDTMQTSVDDDQFGHAQLSSIGSRFFFTLCYYRFNIDDKDESYAGAYVAGVEKTYQGLPVLPLVPTYASHHRATHIQDSQVTDQVGLLGAAARACMQQDVPNESTGAVSDTSDLNTARQRPYTTRSPLEIGLQWRPSTVRAAPGTTPVTLLAEYDVQTDNRRIAIAACGRSLYWAKPAWDGGNVLFAGGDKSYILASTDPTNEANSETIPGAPPQSRTPLVFSCWIKPLRMDGVRMIASKRTVDAVAYNTGIDFLINWMVWVDNGSVCVAGVELDGANYLHWRYVEGTIPAGATDVLQSGSLLNGAWNHLHVTIEGTSVVVRVNGSAISMADCSTLTGALQSNAIGTGDSINSLGSLYLGGLPEGFTTFALPNQLGTDFPVVSESFFGYMADVQVRKTVDTTRWPGTGDGYPLPRGDLDPGAVYAWPMYEGRDYLIVNAAAATAGFDADVQLQEFFPIASGIRQEDGRHYNSLAFRDRLIVTNGADRPRQIQFLGFMSKAAFRVDTLGVNPPVAVLPILQAGTVAGAGIPNGNYQIACSFVTRDGLESEPLVLAEYDLSSGAVGELNFAIVNLPRSPNPQVVKRRIYCDGPGGGGAPIFNRDVLDNDTVSIDFSVYAGTGEAIEFGLRLPAPPGRHIGLAGTSVVLADLPDLPSGQNTIAFSSTNEPSFWPLTTTTIIDSEDGRPITGIKHNLGAVSISKGDSIHQLNVGAIVTQQQLDAAIRLIQSSDGIGGATAGANNMLYGAGDRGVFAFNNTDTSYLTDAIEPTWRQVIDHSVLGLYVMHGAYWRQFSQYWISARRIGETVKDTLLCLDIATGSWSLHRTPGHVSMRVLEVQTSDPVVAIGTLDGRIVFLDDDHISDLNDSRPNRSGAVTQAGSAGLTGTSTSLVMAGANFQTVLAGLQSAVVSITHDGITEDRVIQSNEQDTLYWSEPLTGWTAHTSFVIGAFDGYWTSPWLVAGAIGQTQHLRRLAIECVPKAVDLQVDVASIQVTEAPVQAWPSTAAVVETFAFDMSQGFTQRPFQPRDQKAGAYHRFRFGTYGINDPFELIGYTPEIEVSESRDFTGRRS